MNLAVSPARFVKLDIFDAKESGYDVLNNESAADAGLSRRQMIRRLVSSAGAGVLFAQTALAHPIYKHLADGTLLASAEAHVPAGAWTPKFLNPHQNETLVVLAERIVPNSGKAQVNRFIDLLLSVDNAETRKKFNESLAVFDRESMSRFGQPFKDVSEAKQNELLTAFVAEKPTFDPDPLGGSDEDRPEKNTSVGIPLTLRDHFENLKVWTTGAYYSSEVGLREMGWTGVHFFQDFPGCRHPDGHS
jgi:Gluconate 2-dehydrogenase subunit 3